MARRAFFSFHHKQDSWRAGQVRNSWLTKVEENTFLDAAAWEKVKRNGDAAVEAWIDRELKGTSVTVVLIGKQTAARRWIKYEIKQSYKRGNGMIGVYIHGIKDEKRESSWWRGHNPFEDLQVSIRKSFFGLFDYDSDVKLSDLYPTYYWVGDNGRDNLPMWIEEAAVKAGR